MELRRHPAVCVAGRLLRLAGRVFAAIGLLVVLITVTPLVRWWAVALAGPWPDPRGEVLIVLGGSTVGEGLLGYSSYWRSVYCVLAYRQGGVRRIILSGGGSVAVSMQDFIVAAGVPPELIRLERASRSTRDSALFTRQLLLSEPGRKVLLTSDYHMFRAHRAFRQAGVQVLPHPIPDASKRASQWYLRWPVFIDLVVETAKIAYYFARGWLPLGSA